MALLVRRRAIPRMHRLVTRSLAIALVALAAGSVARAQPRAEPGPARPRADGHVALRPPSLRDFPSTSTVRSPELAAAWRLVDTVLRLRAPRARPHASLADSTRFTRERIAPWLRRKTEAIRAADQALVTLASRHDEQSLIAMALAGLVYEDVGVAVAEIAPPAVIAADVLSYDAYMDALDAQARAMLERSREAYDRCTGAEVQVGAVTDAYRNACVRRRDAVDARLTQMEQRASERDRDVAAAPPRPRPQVAPAPSSARSVIGRDTRDDAALVVGPSSGVLGMLRADPPPPPVPSSPPAAR